MIRSHQSSIGNYIGPSSSSLTSELLVEARGAALTRESEHFATCSSLGGLGFTVEARKLEHSFRRISARIPYTLP